MLQQHVALRTVTYALALIDTGQVGWSPAYRNTHDPIGRHTDHRVLPAIFPGYWRCSCADDTFSWYGRIATDLATDIGRIVVERWPIKWLVNTTGERGQVGWTITGWIKRRAIERLMGVPYYSSPAIIFVQQRAGSRPG